MLQKIISGGQTGADRAALDAGLEAGFPIGGYCPRQRMAEDGRIDDKYPLQELNGGYLQRTHKNVETSDGTLIFYHAVLRGGTAQTLAFCRQTEKPYLLIDISKATHATAIAAIQRFVDGHRIRILNVAGPRQSKCPRIYQFVKATLSGLLLKSG